MNIIIEPHPDDAFLGCSTLLQLGVIDSIITLSSGGIVPEGLSYAKDLWLDMRLNESEVCAQKFGVTIYNLDFPDGELIKCQPTILAELAKIIPNNSRVFVPHYNDPHPDHLTAGAVIGMLYEMKHLEIVWYAVSKKIPNPTVSYKVDFAKKMKLFEEVYPSQYEALLFTNFNFLKSEQFEIEEREDVSAQ